MYNHNFKHGEGKTRFYIIWAGMKTRCLNKNTSYYNRYGGRGIKMCDRWLSFLNFKDDMYQLYLDHVKEFGESSTSLDRKDVNKNYELSNCKWATNSEQVRNCRDSTQSINYTEHTRYRKLYTKYLHRVIYDQDPCVNFCNNYLGLNSKSFRLYIESLWIVGMSWKNYGNGYGKWCIDHIIPCNRFDFTLEEDRKKCWNYKNLQPIWFIKNIEKNRIENGD
ncbi:MAG: hypothetical protein ACREBR_05610 [bacterium]